MRELIVRVALVLLTALILCSLPKPSKGQVLDSGWKWANGFDTMKVKLELPEPNERKDEKLKWWKPTKNDYIVWGLFALSGAADGINQSLLHHRLGQGSDFWNVKTSWKRKYKDFDGGDKSAAYFGSKTILVWTTDGFHLTRAIDHASMYFAIGISTTNLKQYPRKDRWKVMAKRAVISGMARALFFNVIYNNTGEKP